MKQLPGAFCRYCQLDPSQLNLQDAEGTTVLELAVQSGSQALVRFMLASGADTKAEGGGITSLMRAAYGNQTAILEDLLEHGADTFQQTRDGVNVWDYAFASGQLFSIYRSY